MALTPEPLEAAASLLRTLVFELGLTRSNDGLWWSDDWGYELQLSPEQRQTLDDLTAADRQEPLRLVELDACENTVDDRCPECNEFESECVCSSAAT